jgi:hypothetical protein
VVVVTGFGLPVNVLALFWSSFMVVNVGWPRTLIYSEANRFAALSYTILLLVVGASYFWLLARHVSSSPTLSAWLPHPVDGELQNWPKATWSNVE